MLIASIYTSTLPPIGGRDGQTPQPFHIDGINLVQPTTQLEQKSASNASGDIGETAKVSA
jgi:hypothetical protein